MKIGTIDTDRRPLLLAEIGNNHEGDMGVARELIERAAAAGADAVKFQTFKTELFISPSDATRFARLKTFELTYDQFGELGKLAKSLGLLFVSTPLDLESARYLDGVVDAFKVASGDNTFYPLIAQVAATGKPSILAAGLAELDEIASTLAFFRAQPGASDEVAVLHCVSAYPVPTEEANLRAIQTLAERLDCTIGYSDHTIGIEAATLAAALGARIIEKHFTLDHDFSEFRDHKLSADPGELAELARRLRDVDTLLGSGDKTVQLSETEGVITMRRSIVAARDLAAGDMLAEADLMWIRPGGGLPPGNEHLIVGRVLKHKIAFGEQLRPEDVD